LGGVSGARDASAGRDHRWGVRDYIQNFILCPKSVVLRSASDVYEPAVVRVDVGKVGRGSQALKKSLTIALFGLVQGRVGLVYDLPRHDPREADGELATAW
jgi:hypothetical protein